MPHRTLASRVMVALLLVVMLGGFAAHTHEHGASEDGCLCAHGSCPEPCAVGLTFDQPRPQSWDTDPARVPPIAPPAAAPVVRRGPPLSAV